jgi:hypothetical protein
MQTSMVIASSVSFFTMLTQSLEGSKLLLTSSSSSDPDIPYRQIKPRSLHLQTGVLVHLSGVAIQISLIGYYCPRLKVNLS